MGKVLNDLKKDLEKKQRDLDELRARFDRANDTNDVISQGTIALAISKLVIEILTLEKFYTLMEGGS